MRSTGLLVFGLLTACQEYNVKADPQPETLPTESTSTTTTVVPPDSPALQITPSSYAFPTPCADEVELTLLNVGEADLVIEAVDYTASGDLSLVDALPLPLTLTPGEQVPLWVAYDPQAIGPAFGVVDVQSNDPRGVGSAEQAAEAGDSVVETFEVLANPPIDILFALDKSCSMIAETRNLGQAFSDFIDEIGQVTAEWRIGVAVKDSGCFSNGVITASTPDYAGVFLDAVSGVEILGTSLTEQLLELTWVSLSNTGGTSCNAGFIRRDALLHVIAVSDEPEQSGQPWDHWVTDWQDSKADPSLVMVSAVVDTVGDCGQYGQEYVEAAQGTGGVVLDVCSSNWGANAQQLGAASAAGLSTFLLSALPDEATLEVQFDGTVSPTGWHYDPLRNAIVIDFDLPDGTEVRVAYDSLGCEA